MIVLLVIGLLAAAIAIETWAMTLLFGVIHAELLPEFIPAGWPVALGVVLLLNAILGKSNLNVK